MKPAGRRGALLILGVVTAASLLWTLPNWLQDATFTFGIVVWAWILVLVWRRPDHGHIEPWTALAALTLTVVAWTTEFPFTAALAFAAAVMHAGFAAGHLRGLRIPLLAIPLTVPPPGFERFLVALQGAVAWGTEWGLHIVGIDSTRDVLALHTANNTYYIAPLCTGLSTILAVLALLAMAGYHLHATPRRLAAVMAAGLALTVTLNVVRIVFLVVATERWGPRLVEGTSHELVGLALALVAVVALLPAIKPRRTT